MTAVHRPKFKSAKPKISNYYSGIDYGMKVAMFVTNSKLDRTAKKQLTSDVGQC
jgi:hypothetical protein